MKKTLFPGLFLLFLNLNAQVPTTSLVSSWKFSGNANDGVGSNHGTVMGASPANDRFGNCNSAYCFNGFSDYIVMQSGGPTGSVDRTLCFWAKTSSSNLQAVFGYGLADFNGGKFDVLFNHTCSGVGVDNSNMAFLRGNSSLLDGQWHHYAIIVDAATTANMSNVIIYFDGVLLNNTACTVGGGSPGFTTIASLLISIGKDPNQAGRYFDGCLDDFYLYNRAITSAEVQQIYTEQNIPATTTLTGKTQVCNGESRVYSVTPVAGATSYVWSVGSGLTGSSSTNTILLNATGSVNSIVQVTINSACGPVTASLTVNSQDCTGISENDRSVIRIYPNPVNELIYLDGITERATVSIYNIQGDLLMQKYLTPTSNSIDLRDLTPGIYFLRGTGETLFQKRIIKH